MSALSAARRRMNELSAALTASADDLRTCSMSSAATASAARAALRASGVVASTVMRFVLGTGVTMTSGACGRPTLRATPSRTSRLAPSVA